MAKGFKTGGRNKGTPNKASLSVKSLAQQYGPQAVKDLAWLATNAQSETARVAAISQLLDRGYGKPHQTSEVTVTDQRAEAYSDDELSGYLPSRSGNGTVATARNPKVVN